MLHPLFDHGELVEVAGAVAPDAMAHARHHEQTHRIVHVSRAAQGVGDARVVVDAVSRRNQRIIPAVIYQQFSPAGEECLEVRIGRVVRTVVHSVRQRDILVEVEHPEVPGQILEHDVLEVIGRDAHRVRSTGQARPPQFASRLESREDLDSCPGVLHRPIDLASGFHLGGGQTRGGIICTALDRLCIKMASRRIIDHAVFDAVEAVAGVQHGLVDQRVLLLRDVAGGVLQRRMSDP